MTRPAGRLDPARCSVQALARGDSMVATASLAQRWVLIEQPGPWGADALAQSRLDAEVAPLLARRSHSFPGEVREALAGLLAAGELKVGDLPGLDDADRLVLARRLVTDAIATVADSGWGAAGEFPGPVHDGGRGDVPGAGG